MRLFLASCLLATCCHVAHADYAVPRADLICDSVVDVALVRVVMSWNGGTPHYARLPHEIDGGLSQRAGTDRSDCRLPRGWRIRIRAGEEQALPYGAGGADAPTFLSLWIDKRKILSRFVWKPGYGASYDENPPLVGLVIRPGILTFCHQKPNDPAVRCHRQQLEIGRHPVDIEEYPTRSRPGLPVGTAFVAAASANADFCRRHLGLMQGDTRFFEPRASTLQEMITWTPSEAQEKLPRVGSLAGTFPNVGVRRVFLLTGTNHYFDGDIAVLAPHDASERDIPALLPGGDLENATTPSPHGGWTVISGGRPTLYPDVSPRYVHLTPEAIDGELYFLAYPANRKVHPTAILLKPLPDNGFSSVCVFQRVESHY